MRTRLISLASLSEEISPQESGFPYSVHTDHGNQLALPDLYIYFGSDQDLLLLFQVSNAEVPGF